MTPEEGDRHPSLVQTLLVCFMLRMLFRHGATPRVLQALIVIYLR